jgi:hypothetical protein
LDIKNVLIISHGEDIDGLVSAGLAAVGMNKVAKAESFSCIFHLVFAQYASLVQDFEEAVEKIKEKEIDRVIVCDISANDELFAGENSVIKRLHKQTRCFMWFDHHEATKNNNSKFLKIGKSHIVSTDDSMVCTSDLVADYFKISDKHLLGLKELANAHDCLGTKADLETRRVMSDFQNAISYINYTESANLSEGSLVLGVQYILCRDFVNFVRWIHEKLDLYEKCIGSARIEYRKSITIEKFDFNPSKVVFAYASGVFPKKDTVRELQKKYKMADILGVCVVFGSPGEGAYFFSSSKEKFDAAQFCKVRKGGGRGGDGGFPIGKSIGRSDYSAIKDEIVLHLERYLRKK